MRYVGVNPAKGYLEMSRQTLNVSLNCIHGYNEVPFAKKSFNFNDLMLNGGEGGIRTHVSAVNR